MPKLLPSNLYDVIKLMCTVFTSHEFDIVINGLIF